MDLFRKKKEKEIKEIDEKFTDELPELEKSDEKQKIEELLKKTHEDDIAIYRRRLMRGESEKSAKTGLHSFEKIVVGRDLIPSMSWKKPYKEHASRRELIRLTDYDCQKCGKKLYNTKLDGVYYYCPKCKMQYPL